MTVPWINLSKGYANTNRTLLLDYVSMLPPVALGKAVRNRDWMVACTTSISLLLMATIIVSTSLISLIPTQVFIEYYPITLATQFRNGLNSWGESHLGGSLPYCSMQGLLWNNLSYPDGVTSQHAYQSLNTSGLPLDAELHTVVDTFLADMECDHATLELNDTLQSDDVLSDLGRDEGRFHQKFTVRSADYSLAFSTNMKFGLDPYPFARLGSGSCNSSAKSNASPESTHENRLAFMFGNIMYHPFPEDDSLEGKGTVISSTQMLCRPNYGITPGVLVQNGTSLPSLTAHQGGAPKSLPNVRAWDIMDALYDAQKGSRSQFRYLDDGTFYPGDIWLVNASVSTDPLTMDILSRVNREISEPTSLDYAFWEKSVKQVWRQYAAFIAHTRLMEPASLPSTATVLTHQNRLIVHESVGQTMTGLIGACVVLGVVLYFIAPTAGFLPHNPYTISGTASIVTPHSTAMESLTESGWSTAREMETRLCNITCRSGIQGRFTILGAPKPEALKTQRMHPTRQRGKVVYPIPLHPAARAATCATIIGLVIAMEILLRKSIQNTGLGLAGDSSTIHYLWTTLPAAVLSLLSLNLSSIEFQTRAMVPYFNLQKEAIAERTIDLDLLDKMMPTALLTELRIRSGTASTATIAAFIAAFLTILASSLFDVIPVPLNAVAHLCVVDSFSGNISYDFGPNDTIEAMVNMDTMISNLVLAGNQSYPAFTYENLAFPRYSLQDNEERIIEEKGLNLSTMTVDALIPAGSWATPKFSDLTGSSKHRYNCTGELGLEIGIADTESVIAGSMESDTRTNACMVWAWGRVRKSTAESNSSVESLQAMACNETLEVVNVIVRFQGDELRIDPREPPGPDEASAHASVCPIHTENGVFPLPSLYENTLYESEMHLNPEFFSIDPFFALITTSRYAIPNLTLADLGQTQTVRDSILFHHGILRAQQLNFKYRNPSDLTNATLLNPPEGISTANDARLTYVANVTNAVGPLRVIQQSRPTRILEAILAVVLLLSIASWVMMPRVNILPRSPTSIASVMALLAGGDLLDHESQSRENSLAETVQKKFSPSSRF
ncbi:hypothetical protein F5B20DRAFT_590627 [Whalleya microplaca]|nr:hypothetical protein F5B20DRAFT_590627 [Whalleya microplaca]